MSSILTSSWNPSTCGAVRIASSDYVPVCRGGFDDEGDGGRVSADAGIRC
jgi:hypothetical protein